MQIYIFSHDIKPLEFNLRIDILEKNLLINLIIDETRWNIKWLIWLWQRNEIYFFEKIWTNWHFIFQNEINLNIQSQLYFSWQLSIYFKISLSVSVKRLNVNNFFFFHMQLQVFFFLLLMFFQTRLEVKQSRRNFSLTSDIYGHFRRKYLKKNRCLEYLNIQIFILL
jgi:hypothetical protein